MAGVPEEFDVENGTANGYKEFIKKLRGLLGSGRFTRNLPVLPPQEVPPTRWIDIVLRAGPRAITLRIRRDNLYVDGYRTGDAGPWLEFGSDTAVPPPPHLIPQSSFLGFNGDYVALASTAAPNRDPNLPPLMESIDLGQQQLRHAVIQLATSPERDARARSLIVVIQMICESIRFERISNHLSASFYVASPPPSWMLALEHGWGDLSAALLRADADPTDRYFPLPQPNDMEIQTAAAARAVLGIVLAFRCHTRVPRKADVGSCPLGRPLVEVFSVRISNIDGEDPGQLYGTIKVTDGLRCQYVYNRRRESSESIEPRRTALLTGPARSISAYGSFTIGLALYDRDRFSPDDVVSRGNLSWNVFQISNEYDRPLPAVVAGRYGSATVDYAVLSDAVEAAVEVTLLDGDGEDPADVYGVLTARIGKFKNESVLFRRSAKEHVDVGPGELIPLSRSVVAVPLSSSLIVRADLKDHDSDCSSDDAIAKGTAEFPARLYGSFDKDISGKYGKIRVRVSWT